MNKCATALVIALILASSGAGSTIRAADAEYELKAIALPGANGRVGLDYFAYDPTTGQLWVPASNTGNVDVIDGDSNTVKQITGFKTAEVEFRDRKVTIGPTAATIGDGVVYIGNRADLTICVVDKDTLKSGDCLQLAPPSGGRAAAPDGVVYVACAREVWVTTGAPPIGIAAAEKAIQVFDVSDPHQLKRKTPIPLAGSAEGYAVDNQRGIFYTNLEEMGSTVAIDAHTHKVVATWSVGTKELQGLALDTGRGFLFVACGDHVVSLDTRHEGKVIDSIQTGAGLDNIDFSPEKKLLYAAASQAATLTIAEVGDDGKLHVKATVPTMKGARSVVAGKGETAFLIDPLGGRIQKLTRK